MNFKEINSIDYFKEIKTKRIGYVIITDSANPNRIHRPYCNRVQLHNFEEKVLMNNSKNGTYYYTEDREQAKRTWNAAECSYCL